MDKLDIGKLETTSVDLNKLSNAVNNDVIKKTENDELVKKVNNINTTDTSNLVKKTGYNTKFKKKLPTMIMVNMLLLKNLINRQQIILVQD